VATVLQPVSHHSQSSLTEEMSERVRAVLIVAGMFVPILIEAVLGHDHERGEVLT
jgi:solute carrier family 39 (zinc transporter), member 9